MSVNRNVTVPLGLPDVTSAVSQTPPVSAEGDQGELALTTAVWSSS
jgi:hypothetical protein